MSRVNRLDLSMGDSTPIRNSLVIPMYVHLDKFSSVSASDAKDRSKPVCAQVDKLFRKVDLIFSSQRLKMRRTTNFGVHTG